MIVNTLEGEGFSAVQYRQTTTKLVYIIISHNNELERAIIAERRLSFDTFLTKYIDIKYVVCGLLFLNMTDARQS